MDAVAQLQAAVERLGAIDGLRPYASVFAGLLTVYVLCRWLRPDPEAAVDYSVPVPAQCRPGWKGEVLAEPSLKVRAYASSFNRAAQG